VEDDEEAAAEEEEEEEKEGDDDIEAEVEGDEAPGAPAGRWSRPRNSRRQMGQVEEPLRIQSTTQSR
jgi:hypothetical protein